MSIVEPPTSSLRLPVRQGRLVKKTVPRRLDYAGKLRFIDFTSVCRSTAVCRHKPCLVASSISNILKQTFDL